jgi:hypothetical protein
MAAYCAASPKDTLKCVVGADSADLRWTCVFGVKLASFSCGFSSLLVLVLHEKFVGTSVQMFFLFLAFLRFFLVSFFYIFSIGALFCGCYYPVFSWFVFYLSFKLNSVVSRIFIYLFSI